MIFERTLESIDVEKEVLKQSRENYDDAVKHGVSIIVPTFKRKYLSNIFSNYFRSNYPVKELIIVLNNNKLDLLEYQNFASRFENARVLSLDEKKTLGECLNFGIENSNYDYISRMDDDDYYGPNYLSDIMHVFNYTDAQMTGKNPVFVYFEDHKSLYLLNHTNLVMGATFTFKKEILTKVKFRDLDFKEDYYFLRDCIEAGIKVCPSDKYNYVYMRHSNLYNHTFRRPSKEFIQTYDIKKVTAIKDFPSLITV